MTTIDESPETYRPPTMIDLRHQLGDNVNTEASQDQEELQASGSENSQSAPLHLELSFQLEEESSVDLTPSPSRYRARETPAKTVDSAASFVESSEIVNLMMLSKLGEGVIKHCKTFVGSGLRDQTDFKSLCKELFDILGLDVLDYNRSVVGLQR